MKRFLTIGIALGLCLPTVGLAKPKVKLEPSSASRHSNAGRQKAARAKTVKRAVVRRTTGPAPFDQALAQPGDPLVTAARATVIDAATGQVLWARNPDSPAYPASCTKILTAIVFAEHTNPTDAVTAPDDIQKVGEASLHLTPGETLTAENLLTGLLLRSANDGCVMAATHVAGSVEAFADLSNKRAQELGCTHTHFENPNGLHNPNHYTTVHDLAIMGKAALAIPRIASVVSTRKKVIERSPDNKDVLMVSKNALLDKDTTCVGIKTGWTIPAGHCFVGAFERAGTTVVTATMGSADWKADHIALADYATKNFNRVTWVTEGKQFGTVTVTGGTETSVEVIAAKGSSVLLRTGTPVPEISCHLDPVKAPVEEGQKVGYVELPLPGSPRVDLIAKRSVKRAAVPSNGSPIGMVLGTGVAGLVLAAVFRGKKVIRGRR